MANYEVDKRLWDLLTETDKNNIHEVLKGTRSIHEGDTIIPAETTRDILSDIKEVICKAAVDAAYAAAVTAAAALNPVAAAVAIAVATAARDEGRSRC